MGVRPSNRAVSTVADVSLALLIISASVVTLGLYLQERDEADTHRTIEADNTAETLAVSTVSVEYVYTPLVGEPYGYDPSEATLGVHGSAAQLMAEAAVAMAEFPAGDERSLLTEAGLRFEGSVDAAVRSRLVGANNRTQVIAAWQPYRDSTIRGTATAGARPPGDVDVSTATITVSSGLRPVDDEAVGWIEANLSAGDYRSAAEPIARAIVEGLFPPGETQTALESQGFRRDVTVYRYLQFQQKLNRNDDLGVDVDYCKDVDEALDDDCDALVGRANVVTNRSAADAGYANRELVRALTKVVAADLERIHGEGAGAETIAESVSVGDVTIIIRTW